MTPFLKFYPGDAVALLAVNVLVQIAVVVALAWAISLAVARHPALRHGIWLCALGCVLLSPTAAYVAARTGLSLVSLRLLPQPASANLSQRLPSPLGERPAASEKLPSPFGRGAGGEGVDGEKTRIGLSLASGPHPNPLPKGEGTVARSPSSPRSLSDDPRRAVLGMAAVLWAAGVLVLLARLLHGWWSVSRLRRRLQPIDDNHLQAILAEVRRALNVKTLPRLAMWPAETDRAGPITLGVFRPLIILPEKLLDMLDSRGLRDVLVHECAHALRRDSLVGFLQRLAATLYWPFPPVHFLNRRLAWAREEVCDNYVLRQSDAPTYAETLLTISRTLSGSLRPAALGLFHPHGKLERRVAGLLDERRNVMVRTHRVTLAVLAALLVTAVVVVAGTRLSQADPPTAPVPPAAPMPPLPPGPPVPPGAPVDPYHIEPLDVLTIRVTGTLLDQPIDGFYLVEPNGQVALGPPYGRADIKGLTPEQAEEKLRQQLKKSLANPKVQVTLARRVVKWREVVFPRIPYTIRPMDVLQVRVMGSILDQPIDGYYLVEYSGTVPLGPEYGRVQVQGLTLEDAEKAIHEKLKGVLAKPDVQVAMPLPPPEMSPRRREVPYWREVPLPKGSYAIKPGDLLFIDAMGTLLDQPIIGFYLVEPAGTVPLGPAYGRAKVKGLTTETAEKAIQKKLKEVLGKPEVSVTLADWEGAESMLVHRARRTVGEGFSRRMPRFGPPDREQPPRPERPTAEDTLLQQSARNLRDVMSAMHMYHAVAGHFPAARYGWGEDRKTHQWFRQRPYLSWRVLLLPLLGEKELFAKFHTDEPWDSDRNRKLIPLMPKVYRAPGSKAGEGKTNYLGVVGQNAAFPDKGTIMVQDFTDGTSNTIMIVEAPDDVAVEWTRPDDFAVDSKEPVKKLVGLRKEGFLTVFADGSPQFISDGISPITLRLLLVRNDRELVNPVELKTSVRFVPPAAGPSQRGP